MKSNDRTRFIKTLSLILHCSNFVIAETKVSWKLTSEHVKIGNSIVLTCTVDGIKTIDPSITRQWSKGLDGESISLNGHINYPEKYEEILLSGNNFSLKIKNVTEADLQSIYECGYGFDVCKKKLEVNKKETGLSWVLSSDSIKIGGSITLTCTVDGIEHIDKEITRQWAIGKESDIISFNDNINMPSKYEERLSTGNQFSLRINNVTETDLESVYECRYGFDVYKKKLEVNKSRIIDSPSEDTTNITSTETINIRFKMMRFPHPNCWIEYHNKKVLEFQVVSYSGNESYATVSISLPCKDRDSICHKEYDIVCITNSGILTNTISRPGGMFKAGQLRTTLMVLINLAYCLVITVLVAYVAYKRRKRKLAKFNPKFQKIETSCVDDLNDLTSVNKLHAALKIKAQVQDNSITQH